MAQSYFKEITDPTQFLRPLPQGTITGYHEKPKTVDQALANVSDVLDGKGAKIGVYQPDFIIMLNSHLRNLIDKWKRVPTHEEALADMLVKAHPDWNADQLFALGVKDVEANQVNLRVALERMKGATPAQPSQRTRNIPLPAAAIKAAAAPAPAAPAVPRQRPQILVTASTGSVNFRFPVVSWVVSEGVLVLVQEADSPYLWTPGDTAQVIGLAIGAEALYSATWSGISYTIGNDMHAILVLE